MKRNKISIINSGYGNIQSLTNAFEHLNCKVDILNNGIDIKNAEILVLPGVGSFSSAINYLIKHKLFSSLKENIEIKKKKILGICLGMQLMCKKSNENGENKGLNLIPFDVSAFKKKELKGLKTPHIGFNFVDKKKDSILLKNINQTYFYFAHSYRIGIKKKDFSKYSTCKYGIDFLATYEKNNIFATQFHPEKSQKFGLQLLKNFINI